MATMSSTPEPSFDDLVKLFAPYDIRYNAERFKLNNIKSVPLRHAAVLIPVFYRNGELHVLLTVRTKDMPSHAGQVAFPGGMKEAGDEDDIATAFREAHEEVGIDRNKCRVIAVLPFSAVRPSSLVAPVLALIPDDFKPVINPREVDLVFDVPLSRFLSTKDARSEVIPFERGFSFSVVHFYNKVGDKMVDTWGFTAALCIMTAITTYQKDSFTIGEATYELQNIWKTTLTQNVIDYWFNGKESKL